MFSALRKSWQTERNRESLQSNIVAGLTVGVIALPLSMALAIAIGVPPQHGLYTAIIAGLVIALTGGSKVNVSGPTAAFVVILLPIAQQYGLGGLLMAGLMAGCILILMGVFRFGRFIEIVPYPVTVGFTAGIAVVIGFLQVRDFLGLPVEILEGHFLHKLSILIAALPQWHWHEALIGGITLGVMIFLGRHPSRVPSHLVALLVGSVVAIAMPVLLPEFSVATIGTRFAWQVGDLSGHGIPPQLPTLMLPWQQPDADGVATGLSFSLIHALLGPAMTIAMLGAIESLLCAVIADGMSGKKHDPNDELIGQGLGNIVAPFFGGIPATAAIARTTAAVRAGATSPLASVVHALFILLAIVLLAPLLSFIPMASLAALLMMVAWNMSEARQFLRIVRVAPREDVITLLACFSLTVVFDMVIAVAVGMAMAAMLFIRRSAELAEVQPMPVADESDKYKDIPKSIAIYDLNGPLFFASAQKAVKSLTTFNAGIRVIILDMSDVTLLDMTALIAIEAIVDGLERQGIALVVCGLRPRLIAKLQQAHIAIDAGAGQLAVNMNDALTKAHAVVGDSSKPGQR